MGLCASSDDEDRNYDNNNNNHNKSHRKTQTAPSPDDIKLNKAIENQLLEQKKKDFQIFKLLLLGAGESGKSTLFKQCIQLYGRGFSERDRTNYAPVVFSNIIESMKVLIRQSVLLNPSFNCRYSSSPACEAAVQFICNLPDNAVVNRELAGYCKALWADAGIRRTYALRSKFQLPDECAFFFDSLDRVADQQYIPSYDDIIRVRARTTGINDTDFEVSTTKFKLLDVGGQRSERRKWLHCFDHVTSVIFVAAINEYDQVLAEDGRTNRLVEALDLFEDVCNSPWLMKTSMILFLNKCDLFRQKICPILTPQTGLSTVPVPLSNYFHDYNGGPDYEKASEYIRFKFLARNKHPDKKEVFVHVTCATDTHNIRFTLDAVTLIVRENALRSSGLI